jgi:hypothetical protein
VITLSQFFFLHHIPSTNIIFRYKHKGFTILIWCLLLHCLTFLFVVFIVVVFCPISYSTCSLLGLYFPDSFSFPPNPSNFTMVFDYALTNSNMSKFFHHYSCVLCNMATFHVTRHLDLTIMVFECSQPFPNARHG